jgi:hypothetical protein
VSRHIVRRGSIESDLRTLGRRARAGEDVGREWYDGSTLYTWSVIDGVVWRHERGPDGQRFADRRIGEVRS